MSPYYLLENREPVHCEDIAVWSRMMTAEMRRLALTQVTPEVRVSTVFLGINHSFDGGLPLLFESMVFGGVLDDEQERYYTWDAAMEGHEAMVARVYASLKPAT